VAERTGKLLRRSTRTTTKHTLASNAETASEISHHEIPQDDYHPDDFLEDILDETILNENKEDPEPTTDHIRSLVGAAPREAASIGTFQYPLDCNADLGTFDCSTKLVSSVPDIRKGLEIPCGECWTFDMTGTVSIKGINVIGKLVFPKNHVVTIETPSVVVQGELEIETDHPVISSANRSVHFVLTGTDAVTFKPENDVNKNVCGANRAACNIGVRPFVVAGGAVTIRGFPDDCSPWTQLLDVVRTDPVKDPDDFPSYEEFPGTCPTSGTDFIVADFDDGQVGGWTGGGADAAIDNLALKVTNRVDASQGPTLDFTSLEPELCLIPEKKYLFSVRIKLDKEDGTGAGTPTTCTTSESSCPRLRTRITKPPGIKGKWTDNRYMKPRYAGNYGEWVDFTTLIHWDSDRLDPTNTAYLVLVDNVEAGVDITIDSFSITLPSEESFPNPEDPCGNLIYNGDAAANGFHPYPFRTSNGGESVVVMEEDDGNNFFRLTNRQHFSSSIVSDINPLCMDAGVTYQFSMRTRIHSDVPQAYRVTAPLNQNPTASKHSPIVLDCPPQSISDGWVTCTGEFIVSHLMAGVQSDGEFLWRMELKNQRDGADFVIDYDDLSITYSKGYISELVVNDMDGSCWGAGSDVHVATSTFYSFGGKYPTGNGYSGTLVGVSAESDGTHLTLDAPLINPVVTAAQDAECSAEVALLSRNIAIRGDFADGDKAGNGGYLQVLHTVGTKQIIDGVEFVNMGQLGEEDRFAIRRHQPPPPPSYPITVFVPPITAVSSSKERLMCLYPST